MNMRRWSIVGGVVVLAMLVLAVGLTQAQGPEPPEGELGAERQVGPAAAVGMRIPIQGRLTDAGGSPLNGTYTVSFCLYDASTGGNLVCQDLANEVDVSDGLFAWEIGNCGRYQVTGLQLYLEISVEGETLSPRQPIYPVPYAFSLRPGAIISETNRWTTILSVHNTDSGDADAFKAYAAGTGEAVEASAEGGVAVFANSESYIALQAYTIANATASPNDYPAVFGCSADSWNECDPYRDDEDAGVMGYSGRNYGGYFAGERSGVYGESTSSSGRGVYARNTHNGQALLAQSSSSDRWAPTVALVQEDPEGDFILGVDNKGTPRTYYWRVDRTGKGFFMHGTQTGGADFAEQMAVEDEEAGYEPGDVLVISGDADRMVELSAGSFDPRVIGVYSSEPGMLAGAPDTDDPLAGIPVAITGIAPCKVSAENGAIRRGDLLVTAATPAHAMRAGENPPQGTVLGKALGELTEGTGVIDILVTLQ